MPKSSKQDQIHQEQNSGNQENTQMEEEKDDESSNNDKKENENIPKIDFTDIETKELEDSSQKTFTQTQLKSRFGNKWKKAVGELLNDPSLFRKEYVLRQQVTDKFEKHYYLQMMQGDAESLILKSLRNPAYLDVIDFISLKGHATAEELIYYTGCNRYMLSKLTEKPVLKGKLRF